MIGHPRGHRREAATSPRSSSRDFGIPYYSTPPASSRWTGTAAFRPRGGIGDDDQRLAVLDPEPAGDRQAPPAPEQLLQGVVPAGAGNPQSAFAAEQAVDELAFMAKMDPVAFRLQNVANLTDDPPQRWRNVLTAAAKDANWQPKVAASGLSKRQRRHRPRHRVRLLLEHDDLRRRRHHGDEEHRQDRREPAPRRGRPRSHRLPGREREQRGRRRDAGPLAVRSTSRSSSTSAV